LLYDIKVQAKDTGDDDESEDSESMEDGEDSSSKSEGDSDKTSDEDSDLVDIFTDILGLIVLSKKDK
jgi:hypothetical protein